MIPNEGRAHRKMPRTVSDGRRIPLKRKRTTGSRKIEWFARKNPDDQRMVWENEAGSHAIVLSAGEGILEKNIEQPSVEKGAA